MSDLKLTIRYIGYRSLPDGGRRFEFSFALSGEKASMVAIDAPVAFFQGPDQIAIQEAAGICYETLKFHIQAHATSPPDRFNLTSANVAQHRKPRIQPGSRR